MGFYLSFFQHEVRVRWCRMAAGTRNLNQWSMYVVRRQEQEFELTGDKVTE